MTVDLLHPGRLMTVRIALALARVFSIGFIRRQEMRASRPSQVRAPFSQPFPEAA